MKRAIALGGGGPAAGLHIGVLGCLERHGIKFDVWALSCIGAWVGVVYNQCNGNDKAEQTYAFFNNGVFRDDDSYERFPINKAFGPDWQGNAWALTKFLLDQSSYFDKLWLPSQIAESIQQTVSFLTDASKWTEGNYNQWMLNNVLAINPIVRFWVSMMFLSNVNGLSRIYYSDCEFLKTIDFDKLFEQADRYIYHNAWNLTQKRLELFSNRREDKYENIGPASLCACSALPFVEKTVQINGNTYCEGALVDTVNFRNLLEDHFDLDEIWINRIVDAAQVLPPENLHDSLGNLCELFAATVGDDDVKLFKYHVKEGIVSNGKVKKWAGTIVEIHTDPYVNFKWNRSNLKCGRDHGTERADEAYNEYLKETGGKPNHTGKVRFVNKRN
jgi:predicted acylesterase/phospholipase RssA